MLRPLSQKSCAPLYYRIRQFQASCSEVKYDRVKYEVAVGDDMVPDGSKWLDQLALGGRMSLEYLLGYFMPKSLNWIQILTYLIISVRKGMIV